jgi:hypothetical protein
VALVGGVVDVAGGVVVLDGFAVLGSVEVVLDELPIVPVALTELLTWMLFWMLRPGAACLAICSALSLSVCELAVPTSCTVLLLFTTWMLVMFCAWSALWIDWICVLWLPPALASLCGKEEAAGVEGCAPVWPLACTVVWLPATSLCGIAAPVVVDWLVVCEEPVTALPLATPACASVLPAMLPAVLGAADWFAVSPVDFIAPTAFAALAFTFR